MTKQTQDHIQHLIEQLKEAVDQDIDGILVLAVLTTNPDKPDCYIEDRLLSGRTDSLMIALENLKLDLTESDD